MRTIVDIPDDHIQRLDAIAERSKISRAAVVRIAVERYLGKSHKKNLDDCFGLWGGDDSNHEGAV